MRCMNNDNKRAFTFIEILIVTVLLSVISLTIYSTFSNGIKIWQRVTEALPEEDVTIFFEKLAVDVRNCINFKEIAFQGKKDGFEFAGIVKSGRLENTTVGKLKYSYDEAKGVLKREQFDYSQLYTEESGLSNEELSGIKAFKLAYYWYDPQKKEYSWVEEWLDEGQGLPLALRVEFELTYGSQKNLFTRTIGIPVGG